MAKKVFVFLIVIAALLGGYMIAVQTRSSNELRSDTGLRDSQPANTTLDLSGQGLTALPTDVTTRNNVKILNLSNNQLTTLPPEIGNMTNLEEINVENNRLVTIPPEIGKLNRLNKADFSNNRLTSLPSELATLTGLEFLNLSGYDATKSDAQDVESKLTNTEVKF